jgi:hypothetical protein
VSPGSSGASAWLAAAPGPRDTTVRRRQLALKRAHPSRPPPGPAWPSAFPQACGLFSIHPYNPELIASHKKTCSGGVAASAASPGAGDAGDADTLAEGLAAAKLDG